MVEEIGHREDVQRAYNDALVDLTRNPVFVNLNDRVEDFEQLACSMDWVVAIPQADALKACENIDMEQSTELPVAFLKKHVIHASPYLRGEMMSYGGDRLVISKDMILVHDTGRQVKILHRLQVDCVHGRYNVAIVDMPLAALGATSHSNTAKGNGSQGSKYIFSLRASKSNGGGATAGGLGETDTDAWQLEDWMHYFNQDSKNGPALRNLEEFAESIKRSYVFMASTVGTADFMGKVEQAVSQAIDRLMEHNFGSFAILETDPALRDEVACALEAYTLMGTHQLVFNFLIGATQQNEVMLGSALADIEYDVVQANTSAQFFTALNLLRSPLTKLEYMADYLQAVSDKPEDATEVLRKLISNSFGDNTPKPALVLANFHYMYSFTLKPLPEPFQRAISDMKKVITEVCGPSAAVLAGRSPILSQIAHPPTPGKHSPVHGLGGFLFRPGSATSIDSAESSNTALSRVPSHSSLTSTSDLEVEGSYHGPLESDADNNAEKTAPTEAAQKDIADLGCFLTALKEADADVVRST